jgi:hypothetical protein
LSLFLTLKAKNMATSVILADALEPRINQIRAICEDWTRAGLISQSIWIDIQSELNVVMKLDESGREDIVMSEWLTSLPADEEIQLVVLQPLLTGIKPMTLEFILNKLHPYSKLFEATAQLTNLVCPFSTSQNVQAEMIYANRLNLVAVPADSLSPGAADLPIDEKSDNAYSYIAVQLCSAASLWIGVERVKPEAVGDMKNVQLQRTYVRYVDASELVDDIVLAVIREAANPVSRVFNRHGLEFDSVTDNQSQIAIKLLVEKFMEQNKESLGISPEKPFEGAERTATGIIRAIKMYLEFIFRYLLKAPGRWAREKIAVLTKKVADTVQRNTFGDDSSYQIVVNGIAGGSSASPDVDKERAGSSAAEQLLDVANVYIQNQTNIFPAPHSPRDVWSDFIQIALGLLDGGIPRSTYPMPQVEGIQESLVFESPTKVVPPVSGESFVIPANIPISLSGVAIGSDDPYLALVALQQLQDAIALDNSAAVAAEMNEQVALLQHWMDTNESFAWDVGRRLGGNLNDARLRLRQIGLGLSTKFSEDKLVEAEYGARRAIMNMFKASFALILTTIGVAFFTPAALLMPIILIGGAVLVVANIIGGIFFQRAIREFFQAQHQLNEDEKRHQHIISQKINFARDVQRLAVVYIQYRSWVRLLAETVYHPFGKDTAETGVRVSPIRLLTDLTKSLAVGRLATTDTSKDKLLDGVKRKFFQKGWRLENFDRFLTALGADKEHVWADEGVGKNSKLAEIANLTNSDWSRGQLIEDASKAARKMAVASADYRDWPILATGESKVNPGNTCLKFLSPLLAPVDYLSQQLIVPREQGTANEVHPSGSLVYMDDRIDVGSLEKVAVVGLARHQLTDYQELDFMGVRIERSVLFAPQALSFLALDKMYLERQELRAKAVVTDLEEVQG